MVLTYCDTKDMLADALTKPMVGQGFRKLKESMMHCTLEETYNT